MKINPVTAEMFQPNRHTERYEGVNCYCSDCGCCIHTDATILVVPLGDTISTSLIILLTETLRYINFYLLEMCCQGSQNLSAATIPFVKLK